VGEAEWEGYKDEIDLLNAHKLAIEALKHIRRERLLNIHIIPTLLPSETKEGELAKPGKEET